MKLVLYLWDGKLDAARAFAEIHAERADSTTMEMVPPVRAADGRQLLPADGDAWLVAVHEEMRNGSMCWSELVP